jgi:hypothetical protein
MWFFRAQTYDLAQWRKSIQRLQTEIKVGPTHYFKWGRGQNFFLWSVDSMVKRKKSVHKVRDSNTGTVWLFPVLSVFFFFFSLLQDQVFPRSKLFSTRIQHKQVNGNNFSWNWNNLASQMTVNEIQVSRRLFSCFTCAVSELVSHYRSHNINESKLEMNKGRKPSPLLNGLFLRVVYTVSLF